MNTNAQPAEVAAGESAGVNPAAPRGKRMRALDSWMQAQRAFAALLRTESIDAAWLERLEGAMRALRSLAAHDIDTALYVLLHAGITDVDRYSAHHAMLCAVAAEACAGQLGWDEERIVTTVRVALTMNVSISALQDSLARQMDAPSASQRELVASHAERSAKMLQDAGVADACWIEAVRHHHAAAQTAATASPQGAAVGAAEGPTEGAAAGTAAGADGAAPGAREIAQLVHRIDVYTAKLSRRTTRAAISPALAARAACLDGQGHADAIGGTILRCLGLYPPGCFVQLANGDLAIVVRRGRKAHTPIVAAVRRGDGGVYEQPLRCDTAQAPLAVVRGVPLDDVKVRLNHGRALAVA